MSLPAKCESSGCCNFLPALDTVRLCYSIAGEYNGTSFAHGCLFVVVVFNCFYPCHGSQSLMLQSCIIYLLMHNKLHQNLVVSNNNKPLLPHTFSVSQELQSSLAGWFLPRVFPNTVVKMLSGATAA